MKFPRLYSIVSSFILLNIVFSVCFLEPLCAQQMTVRLKDLGRIIEARENQLMGFGLVVGLRNTGDTKSTGFTHLALRNLLGKMGVSVGGLDFNARNVAAVMVTASLPPFLKAGQKISVTVSAVGDSNSLVGGTLLMTPLQGADMATYAVAQGPVVVGGIMEQSVSARFMRNQTTVGTIPEGAIVEQEVPVTYSDLHNITVVLNESNFVTVSNATEAIQKAGFSGAKAIDANTIKIPLTDLDSSDLVTTIATLEGVQVKPDTSAKIVINSRTGTVVIGEKVKLFPAAVTHGSISIRINDSDQKGGGFGAGGNANSNMGIDVNESDSRLIYLTSRDTLSGLVNALNEVGASPKDLVSIIEQLKAAGALVAEVQII